MESRYGTVNLPLRCARRARRSTQNGKSLGIKQSGTEKSTSMPAMIRMIGISTFSRFPDQGKADAEPEDEGDSNTKTRTVGWVEPFARPNARNVGSREELDPTYNSSRQTLAYKRPQPQPSVHDRPSAPRMVG